MTETLWFLNEALRKIGLLMDLAIPRYFNDILVSLENWSLVVYGYEKLLTDGNPKVIESTKQSQT